MKESINLSWEKEFSELDLGDKRLTRRFLTVLEDLSTHPPASIYESSLGDKSKTKAAYRLMDQEKLDVSEVWNHHQQKTVERMREFPVVLAISDTTIFNFESHLSAEGLGRIGKNKTAAKESQGLHCHNILAVTPDKVPLGILDQEIFARKPKKKSKKKIHPGQVPYLEKESARWSLGLLKGLSGTPDIKTQVIAVSDRESDINAYLGTAVEAGVDFVVRCKFERKEHETHQYLNEFMKAQPVQGVFNLDVVNRTKKTGDRRKPTIRLKHAIYRTATIEVRWSKVQIRVENLHDERRIETLVCIYAVEKKVGLGDRIEWLLVTSLPVETLAAAREVIDYYSTRWVIEVFHKMQKTGGCRIEDCRLKTRDRLERYITMESLVALKLTQLTYYQRCNPDVPCTDLTDDLTWQAAYCFTNKTKNLPKTPPTANEFTIMVAKLGGYLNRNLDPYPGGIVLRRGWERLQDMRSVYAMFRQ